MGRDTKWCMSPILGYLADTELLSYFIQRFFEMKYLLFKCLIDFFYAYRSIKSIKSKYLMLKNLWMKNDDISVSAWRPRRRDLHHFVSLPTNLKIWKNEIYSRIPHDNKNNLPWPKKLFSDFVSSKTTVRSGTSLDFCYCTQVGNRCTALPNGQRSN